MNEHIARVGKIIEALRICGAHNGCDGCPYSGKYAFNDCAYVLNLDAADAIEELLSAVPHWISVEDELPSRYETVLLNIQTCKDSYVTIGDYEPNELRFRDFADRNNQVYCGDIVTHWMPLPLPPKGDV